MGLVQPPTKIWLLVWNIFFHPYLGKWSNLTHIFQMGSNHQLKFVDYVYIIDWVKRVWGLQCQVRKGTGFVSLSDITDMEEAGCKGMAPQTPAAVCNFRKGLFSSCWVVGKQPCRCRLHKIFTEGVGARFAQHSFTRLRWFSVNIGRHTLHWSLGIGTCIRFECLWPQLVSRAPGRRGRHGRGGPCELKFSKIPADSICLLPTQSR